VCLISRFLIGISFDCLSPGVDQAGHLTCSLEDKGK
jgi:hypothetical protein